MAVVTEFAKTVVISSISAGGKTDVRDTSHTNSLTQDDIDKHGPFNALLVTNTTDTSGFTSPDTRSAMVRVKPNNKSDDFADVPADNGQGGFNATDQKTFEYTTLENLDGSNATGTINVTITKVKTVEE